MTTSQARLAASVFSSAHFRPFLARRSPVALEQRLRELADSLSLSAVPRYRVFDAAFQLISRSYRTEYVYKNSIVNRVFVGRHRASNSAMLQEFAVSGSVADCMFINGKITAYEIKTELDSSSRLTKQISDYLKVAEDVYVVTHPALADRYAHFLRHSGAGILVVKPNLGLSMVKPSQVDGSALDVTTMFKSLRAGEVERIINRTSGAVPAVPNGRRFSTMLNLALEIDPRNFHREMCFELKLRGGMVPKALILDPVTVSLRSTLLRVNLTGKHAHAVSGWLREEV